MAGDAIEAEIRAVDAHLAERYGSKAPKKRPDPLSGLIRTILSQSSTSANTSRAFESLRERFESWDELADASDAEIADAIHSGGLANQKAPRIRAVVKELIEERGEASLEWIDDLPTAEALEYLTHFKGVGPKTAACVLLFSLGRPVFPVDTHVHRVAIRLGWIPPDTDAASAHDLLGEMIPENRAYQIHLNIVQHGRETCRSQNPACAKCVLLDLCDHGQDQMQDNQ
ncbi:MAG: endonuclease III [Armatimonadota bacterium]